MPFSAKRNLPVIRHFLLRPRLGAAILFGIGLWFCLPAPMRNVTRILVAWDAAVFLYLMLASMMMYGATSATIKKHAAGQDEGGLLILFLTIFTAVASLAAIVAELATAKTLTGTTQWEHIILAGVTVFLSWTFMQSMFALHYAHEYYSGGRDNTFRGLEFPDQFTTPDYWDFIYFSFIIGTAAQTADINITSRSIRRIVTLHCIVVFFFNTTILALTINIGAGLF